MTSASLTVTALLVLPGRAEHRGPQASSAAYQVQLARIMATETAPRSSSPRRTACPRRAPASSSRASGNGATTRDCTACHVGFEGRHSHPVDVDHEAARFRSRGGSGPSLRPAAEVVKRGIFLADGKVTCLTCHDGNSPWKAKIALPPDAQLREPVKPGNPQTYDPAQMRPSAMKGLTATTGKQLSRPAPRSARRRSARPATPSTRAHPALSRPALVRRAAWFTISWTAPTHPRQRGLHPGLLATRGRGRCVAGQRAARGAHAPWVRCGREETGEGAGRPPEPLSLLHAVRDPREDATDACESGPAPGPHGMAHRHPDRRPGRPRGPEGPREDDDADCDGHEQGRHGFHLLRPHAAWASTESEASPGPGAPGEAPGGRSRKGAGSRWIQFLFPRPAGPAPSRAPTLGALRTPAATHPSGVPPPGCGTFSGPAAWAGRNVPERA